MEPHKFGRILIQGMGYKICSKADLTTKYLSGECARVCARVGACECAGVWARRRLNKLNLP